MLEGIESSYAHRFGTPPFSISHWDPSEDFQRDMLKYLDLPMQSSLVDYRFSYQVNETDDVLCKLGGTRGLHHGLFAPSCTSSILCALNWLKCRHKTEMTVICPSYFSVFHACRQFGIVVHHLHLKRKHGEFLLPEPTARIWNTPSTLWITSPVYGAGVYLSFPDVNFIRKLLKNGWTVIADECLALPGHELIRELGEHPNFLAIYSPHKSLCINGIKFSVLVLNKRHQKLFERWTDVWYGGLGCSASVAITHFLGNNFDSYAAAFVKGVNRQTEYLRRLCAVNGVEFDPTAEGHFASCYFPTLSSKLGSSRRFLQDLVNATGAAIIPGNRSRFNRAFGFSFRVNLARKDPRFDPALTRIIRFVCSYADKERGA